MWNGPGNLVDPLRAPLATTLWLGASPQDLEGKVTVLTVRSAPLNPGPRCNLPTDSVVTRLGSGLLLYLPGDSRVSYRDLVGDIVLRCRQRARADLDAFQDFLDLWLAPSFQHPHGRAVIQELDLFHDRLNHGLRHTT